MSIEVSDSETNTLAVAAVLFVAIAVVPFGLTWLFLRRRWRASAPDLPRDAT